MLNACPTEIDFDVYQPRNPKARAYYRCVEDHFEQLETVWDERYQRRFGFWRPYVMHVIHRYLDCGDLHCCNRCAELWPPARRLGQAYGSESGFQNFHPHLHVLATDGCFYNDTAFMVCPPPDTGALEKLFRYEVLKMLKAEGKITDVIIENMMNWPPARRALEPTPRRAPQWIQCVLRQSHLAAQ